MIFKTKIDVGTAKRRPIFYLLHRKATCRNDTLFLILRVFAELSGAGGGEGSQSPGEYFKLDLP
jgi:hypothetical protein